MYGDDGNDVLEGNAGNDILTGGAGSDTYIYRRGDGNDIINDFDDSETGSSSIDTLRLEGFDVADVKTKIKSGSDLILQLYNIKKTSYNTITLKNYYASNATVGGNQLIVNSKANYKVEKVVFDDGTWGAFELEDQVKIYGTADNDVITGGIEGGNIISSRTGDDIIESGKGNDAITDTAGNDTYIYRRGDGNDTIEDTNNITDTGIKTIDTIRFVGFIRNDIQDRIKDGYNLILKLRSGGSEIENSEVNTITIKNYFAGNPSKSNYKIEVFEFDDGVLSSEEIESSLE